MHADHLRPRHGKQTERIPIAEILFGRKREAREIRQRAHIVRMRAHRIAFRTIRLHVVVGVSNRPLQASELYALEFIAAGTLDWLDRVGIVRSSGHGVVVSVRDPIRASGSMFGHCLVVLRRHRGNALVLVIGLDEIRERCLKRHVRQLFREPG